MQRTLTLDDKSFSVVEASAESFCLVCDTVLNVASSTNIFYTSMPRNGELLASFVLRVLRPVASNLRSSYICSRCNELFRMLEQAYWTVSNIRSEILKVYRSRESHETLEHKDDLPGGQILPDELFIEHKTVLEGDRFNEINKFRTLGVEGNVNVRSDTFDDSPNEFSNLNIEIDNVDKKLEKSLGIREDSVYGSKIDCLKALDNERVANVARTDSFHDSPNEFSNLNIGIDNVDKKLEKSLGIHEDSVYGSRIDCHKGLNNERVANLVRSDSFHDSPNAFSNLNVGIDNVDKKLEKSLGICEDSVYGSRIDCLKGLNNERVANLVRNDSFQDSPNELSDLNVGIDNVDKKLEKSLGIREDNVYGSKIDCLKGLNNERVANLVRSDSFQDSPNELSDLNVGIDNVDKKLEKSLGIREDNVYGSKIDCLKGLNNERVANLARNDSFHDSPNAFSNLNVGIDNVDKKLEKSLGICEDSVYGSRIDCLKGLNNERVANLARSDSFHDSPNEFSNLNIGIDNIDKKLKKSLGIREVAVYGSKIDCFKALDNERVENVTRNDAFDDSPNKFSNLNIGVRNGDQKVEKHFGSRQNSVYGSKIGALKIEEPTNVLGEKEAETTTGKQKCSKNAMDLMKEISTDVSNNSIDTSAERLTKDDKKALYTLRCGTCPRLFKFAEDLRSHSLKHGGSRPYHCRKCDERFGDLSLAKSHATAMHSSKKNCIAVATEPCNNEIVDFTGDDWIILDESENHQLETDNKTAERVSSKSGRTSKYSLKPLKYSCSTCGKKWRTSAELKTHVKSHSNLRPYMCEKCGQAYKHKHALEIHVGMHNGISPYQCSVCNKCFTQKGALMRHLPMHTGEMPYQCELCGKRFVHHTSYNMHALSHTGKKSYQCHVCDLSLLSTSHLKRHMRVHTGEKPYSCELCGKSFAERYNLFAHQKIHDPAEIMAKAAKKTAHKCEQCDEYFGKRQKLDEHTKERHSSTTDGRKWIGHTVDVENIGKTSGSLVDQSWQDYNYSKLQSVVMGIKTAQNDNSLNQLSQESIALLMSQTNYNKSLADFIQPTNSTAHAEIDQTQI